MTESPKGALATIVAWCQRTLCSLTQPVQTRIPKCGGVLDCSIPEHLNSKQVGKLGERIAKEYLTTRGYEILDVNWWAPKRRGELDIVARRGDTIIAVEVRSYRAGDMSPREVLNRDKRRRLIRLIELYVRQRRYFNCNMRVDLFVIEWATLGKVSNIRHFERVATEHDR
jgi:putative endonuclease